MRKTNNYGLGLYEREDKFNITGEENSLNANMEIIDGALKEKANNKDIPTKVSELTNDSGFLTEVELTEEQLTEITDAVIESQKIEIVNSIDEMTDTTKRYVLPDGYIYEYKLVETVGGNYTNLVPTATTTQGGTEIYNELGYYNGKYVSSSNSYGTDANCVATGHIASTLSDTYAPTIYVKGIILDNSVNSHCRMYFNKPDGTTFELNILNSSVYYTITTLDEKYYKLSPILDNGKPMIKDNAMEGGNITFRISGVGTGENLIITIDEPIEDSTILSYEWVNTGLTFTPTDYGDKITALENRTATIEEKIEELVLDANGTPLYIGNEAERVANEVQSRRTVGSLTFTAMSDAHVYVGTTTSWLIPNESSVRDAGLGLVELRKRLKLDLVAMLGDYTYGSVNCTIEQLKKDLQYFKKCMSDGCNGVPNLWATGNHDINYNSTTDRRMTEDELYAHIISNNVGTTQDTDNIERNYGYIDFENQKFRCIMLNSVDSLDYPDNTDTKDEALEITATQTQWLVDVALDLSEKTNPEDWQIIIFTHHSLNLYSHVMTVLEAHKNGTSGSVDVTTNNVTTTVNYDFTNKTRGEVIANIHGHNHNFTAKKTGISEEWLWRICVPNMDVTRNNEVATSSDTSWANKFGEFDENGDPVYYNKTQGTATSTSFCVFVIDRKNRKIHALRYGAGIDRELEY